MAHEHEHCLAGNGARTGMQKRLTWTLAIVLVYMAAEVAGGILTHSLALLADAGHMLSDAASLGLALFAGWIAQRPRTAERTFGYHRTEILAALANGITLVAIAVYILIEAWGRVRHPVAVRGELMMWIAVGGLVANLAGMVILHGGRNASINIRGAWLHVISDALGSVQTVVAGALIWAFGWNWADPVASILVAALVVASAWSLLREAVGVLMEGTPAHVDTRAVKEVIAGVDGVREVHDLHVWTITSGFVSLSAHVVVPARAPESVLEDVRGVVRERFGIEHSTIQLERSEGSAHGDCD
jgi:cobalt-zinc-cadmium efflux system protein